MKVRPRATPMKSDNEELMARRIALKNSLRRHRVGVADLLTRLEQRDPLMARAARDLLGDPRRASRDTR